MFILVFLGQYLNLIINLSSFYLIIIFCGDERKMRQLWIGSGFTHKIIWSLLTKYIYIYLIRTKFLSKLDWRETFQTLYIYIYIYYEFWKSNRWILCSLCSLHAYQISFKLDIIYYSINKIIFYIQF